MRRTCIAPTLCGGRSGAAALISALEGGIPAGLMSPDPLRFANLPGSSNLGQFERLSALRRGQETGFKILAAARAIRELRIAHCWRRSGGRRLMAANLFGALLSRCLVSLANGPRAIARINGGPKPGPVSVSQSLGQDHPWPHEELAG